jgi:hypothetical protein
LVFGGVHPNEIAAHEPIRPYLASLLKEAYVDIPLYEQAPKIAGLSVTIDIERYFSEFLRTHPRDLSSRVHFMGALDDADFHMGMAICDVVVFPYLEVGQSSSGPISQAVELGCRIIASRTHTFLVFAAYHPNTIEFFDIGNHLELAERVVARRQFAARSEPPRYNFETNKAVYLAANTVPTRQTAARFSSLPRMPRAITARR